MALKISENQELSGYKEAYRNHLGNVTREGERLKIYPQHPLGAYYRIRQAVSWLLLGFLFAGPLVRINGQPLFLFNVIERKFVFFGVPFWSQDMDLVLLLLLTTLLFILLFTTVFGRIWCGWACPQTIFTEMVFRKIEYLIEGNHLQQQRLDQTPWTTGKTVKKITKHGIFLLLSFFVSNTFLAYVIGSDALVVIITDPILDHLQGLILICLFSLVFYSVFAHFREQVCVLVCPYGRLQSTMVDEDTIAVTYDFRRGEPRKSVGMKNGRSTKNRGDCIDCGQCISVCPTGIDIRNGIQLECINCTACMDACDRMMKKLRRPMGLIRYASLKGITRIGNKYVRPRVVGYAVVFSLLLILVACLAYGRPELDATILRERGMLFTELSDGRIANFYGIKLINKTFEAKRITIEVELLEIAEVIPLGSIERLKGQSLLNGRFLVAAPKSVLMSGQNDVRFVIYSDGREALRYDSSFISPLNDRKL